MNNMEIADSWRQQIVSPLQWIKCQNQAGAVDGEAGGFFVEAAGFPRRGYLKPVKPHPHDTQNYSRAAREKIASDLAYDLGLPVPPAVLSVRDDAPNGCEKAVVVTLVMYPKQHPWESVKRYTLDESPHSLALAESFSKVSNLYAFDTWVQQTDHNDHPHNIVWGYGNSNPVKSSLVFLDFAFSLGFRGEWASDGWKNVELAPFPPHLKSNLDFDVLQETLDQIEAFDDERLEEIVMRIPDSHLDGEQKATIYTGLSERKTLVADKFKSIMPSAA